jgi:hypothetical protein
VTFTTAFSNPYTNYVQRSTDGSAFKSIESEKNLAAKKKLLQNVISEVLTAMLKDPRLMAKNFTRKQAY